MEKYVPSEYETKLCEKVFEEFNKYYPAYYIRVDIVGDGADALISEIECINPDYITCYGYHTKEDYEDFYSKLYSCFR